MTNPRPTNSRSHGELVTHSWEVRRPFSLLLGYRYSNETSQVSQQPEHPTESHLATLGLEWRKRLSPRRTISFSGGSGAMHVQTISTVEDRPLDYVAPAIFGRARLDLARTWSISADARRDVTVLEGVTRQSFLTDMVSLWLGGYVGRTWAVAVNGSMSRGAPHEGESGAYQATTGTAQVQYAFSSCCSLIGNYTYYSHLLLDLASVPLGFPRRYERNALRVGMTLGLPLYGRSTGTRQPQTGRN
jgi:hypothetical protein